LLWIDHGNIAALEGYSFEEPWPKNIQTFCACYTHNPRDEEALTRRLQAAVRRSLISSIDSRK
jgi:hypothetical protein